HVAGARRAAPSALPSVAHGALRGSPEPPSSSPSTRERATQRAASASAPSVAASTARPTPPERAFDAALAWHVMPAASHGRLDCALPGAGTLVVLETLTPTLLRRDLATGVVLATRALPEYGLPRVRFHAGVALVTGVGGTGASPTYRLAAVDT